MFRKRNSNWRSSYIFTKKRIAGLNKKSTHNENSADRKQIPNERKNAKPASTIGIRVREYNSSTANFRLSKIPGAPNPLIASFSPTDRETIPVIMVRIRPIAGGIGNNQSGQF